MRKKNYILVHGAWHGKWCWDGIKGNLESAGHLVLTPDLPGHGDNQKPLPQITLDTYVDFICGLLAKLDGAVILVGHSMAGIIISQVAERMPEKIEELIYVAAYLPKNNESLMETARKSAGKGVSTEMLFVESNNEIIIAKSDRTKALFFNCCTPDVGASALALLESEPLQPFTQRLTLSEECFGRVKKLYVLCTKDEAILPIDQRRMYEGVIKDIVEIPADHSPFLSSALDLTMALQAEHRHLLNEKKSLNNIPS
jgi:pimeloyl-ACP methyl ester carboxylesterase